MEATALWWS